MRLRVQLQYLTVTNRIRAGVLTFVLIMVCIVMIQPERVVFAAGYESPLSVMEDGPLSVNYWIEDETQYPLYYNEEGVTKGYYFEMIKRLERQLDIPFNRIELSSSGEAVEMLEQGGLDLVFGLNNDIAEHENITISEAVFTNSFIAVTLPDNEEITTGMIKSCYWGIEELWLPVLNGTSFMDHTIDSISQNSLYDSLKNKDIYGILIKKSTLDYSLLISEEFDYRIVENVRIPFQECLLLNSHNAELNRLIKETVSEYTAEARLVYEQMHLSSYINVLADTEGESQKIKENASILGIITMALTTLLISVSALLAINLRREKRRSRQLHDNDTEKNLFEVNIKRRTITAIHGFDIFGIKTNEYGDVMKLEELSKLTGFDFISHYDGVLHDRIKQYQRRFILYRGGRKLFISENGCVNRNYITITLTDVSLSKGREGEIL